MAFVCSYTMNYWGPIQPMNSVRGAVWRQESLTSERCELHVVGWVVTNQWSIEYRPSGNQTWQWNIIPLFIDELPIKTSGWWFGIFGLFFHWECHDPNWLTPSCFRGVGWNHQSDQRGLHQSHGSILAGTPWWTNTTNTHNVAIKINSVC